MYQLEFDCLKAYSDIYQDWGSCNFCKTIFVKWSSYIKGLYHFKKYQARVDIIKSLEVIHPLFVANCLMSHLPEFAEIDYLSNSA